MGSAEVLCGGLEVYTGKGGPRALKFGCLGASGGYETRCNGDLCSLYFLWDRLFHSSRLWVSELSGWERLPGGKKCLFFDKRGMHAFAPLI